MKKIFLLFAVLFMSLGAQSQSVETCDSVGVKATIYNEVDINPEFPGGMSAMMKYMQANVISMCCR